MTVLTPKSDQPEVLSYREDLQRKFAPGKHEQRRYESCHAWHIKDGRIQSANNHLSQIIHDFYIYLFCQFWKMVKSFNGQRYRCGIYIALLKTTSLCTFAANKCHRSTEEHFTFSDSLPAVKSNTEFDKMTLMALEKWRKIWFTSVSAWRD